MVLKDHSEIIQFCVSHFLANVALILGKEWLRKHDPTISFKDQTVEFNSKYCKENCCSSAEEIQRRLKEREEKKEIPENYGKNKNCNEDKLVIVIAIV